MLLEDARIGDLAFDPVDRSLIGCSSRQRPRHARADSPSLRPLERASTCFPYESVPYDLDISADGRLLSASMSEINGDQFLRVWEIDKLAQGDVEAASRVQVRPVGPRELRVLARTAATCTAAATTPACRTSFATRSRPATSRPCRMRRSGLFRPVPLDDGRCSCSRTPATGFVPAIDRAEAARGPERHHLPGRRGRGEAIPVVKHGRCRRRARSTTSSSRRRKGRMSRSAVAIASGYPVLQGYKNTVGLGYRLNFDRSARVRERRCHGRAHADRTLGGQRAYACELNGEYLGWRGALSWNRSDFYDLFGPTKRSRKGYAVKLGYDSTLIYDEPRQLDLRRRRLLRQDRHAAERTECRHAVHAARTAEIGLQYTDVRRSLGAVDDEKGVAWSTRCQGSQAQRHLVPQLRGTFDFGFAAAVRAFVDLASDAAGVAQRRPQQPARQLLLRRLRQQLRRRRHRSSAIASTTRCRASGSTRSAAQTSCAR